MVYPAHLLKYVVYPVNETLGMNYPAALKIVMGTAAKESAMGKYLHQKQGPAMGVFQIELATCKDILFRYLKRREHLAEKLVCASNWKVYAGVSNWPELTDEDLSQLLHTDLRFQAAICRLKYWMVPEPLEDNWEYLSWYWNKFYNANDEHGTEEEFLNACKHYKLDELLGGKIP